MFLRCKFSALSAPLGCLILACGPAEHAPPASYPPPILNPLPPLACRIQNRAGGLYDAKLQTPCEVATFNGKTVCLPKGMWEEVGAAWATPECDRLLDWSKRNGAPCLTGESNFTLSTYPHAGLPQVCGDFVGIIYQISPTDRATQYDKANGCAPFPFQLDLSVSRYSDYVPYPPRILTELDFIDPASEQGCAR